MTNAQLLLVVILVQHGLFSLLWIVAARLKLARRPALHWAAGMALSAAAMPLLLLRDVASPWLTIGAANLLVIIGFALVRRGTMVFARLVPADREQAVVVIVGAACLAAAVPLATTMLPVMISVSMLLAWTLLRSAHEMRGSLRSEFGNRAALGLSLPMFGIGLVYGVRGILGPFVLQTPGASIASAATTNVPLIFVSMIFTLVLNTTLVALVITRLVRRLQYQSEHDALTGLLGRRALEKLLQAEALRQRRSGQPMALLAIDIDHFKRVNDRCGHPAGDAVLLRVAQALRNNAREVDSVARMGGEEFCVLLPATPLLGASRAARRLLEAVRQLEHPEARGLPPVTISIGVAVSASPDEPTRELLRRVDKALYAAKHFGRDRIEVEQAPEKDAAAAPKSLTTA